MDKPSKQQTAFMFTLAFVELDKLGKVSPEDALEILAMVKEGVAKLEPIAAKAAGD